MTAELPLPFDVRLMNFTTGLLLGVLLVGVLASGAWWAGRSPVFAIRQITVTGDTQHNTETSLYSAIAGRMQGNFFTLNLTAAEQAFQNVPWVRNAVVQRRFPNQLHVRLHEHVPVARWAGANGALVDRDGAIFETGGAPGQQADLPLLAGPDGQGDLMLRAWQALSAAAEALQTPIVSLELQPRGHWHARLAQGAQIDLGQGTPRELTERMMRFADTAGQVAGRYSRSAEDIEAADLRYEHGYALRLRGVTTGGEGAPGARPDE